MQEIVPYVHMPERLVPGIPLQFATTLPLGGYGRGVVCTSVKAVPSRCRAIRCTPRAWDRRTSSPRPTCSRSTTPTAPTPAAGGGDRRLGRPPDRAGGAARAGQGARGDRLRLLTGPVSSPTLLRQIGELRALYPGLRWHVHDPLEDRAARRGAQLAFGRDVTMLPRLAEAAVIVTLDADPLGPGPAQIAHGRGFADRRRVRGGAGMNSRLYAFASVPTATAAKADHRLSWRRAAIGHVAQALAARSGPTCRTRSWTPG